MHTMKTIRTAAIITMGLAGSGAVLAIIIMTTHMLTLQTRYVSDVLPSDKTVLLIHRPLEQNLKPFSAWFSPETLAHLPSGTEGLALLQTEEGTVGAAVLVRSNTQNSDAIALPPFTAYTSNAAIAHILQSTYTPLTRNETYTALRTNKKPTTPWTYMDTALLVQKKPANALTTAVLGSGSHIGIEQRAENTIVQIVGAFAAPPALSAPAHSACIATCIRGNVAWAWHAIQTHLTEEEANILQSIAMQWFVQAFGENVSWTYEILPLLTKGALQVELPASGSLLTIEGTAASEKAAATLAERLHQSHAERYVPTEVQKTLLDERFPVQDIRIAEKQEPIMSHSNSWRIQQSGNAVEKTLLITAVRGSNFIVSQNPQLPAILAAESKAPSTRLHLAGHIDKAALADLLAPYGIENLQEWLYIPIPPLSEQFSWELEQEGLVRTLRIRRQQ
ncbi:MAG: hypothetical protein WCX29_01180 [Candidatus Peribacteraceae bacterium]|nr:hypothetical protein [Candidatus Peribacteria bacterium]